MMKAAEVRHQHELALSIYQNALGILRTSIGRPR
jgi:flagellar basal-body rod protein FlgB